MRAPRALCRILPFAVLATLAVGCGGSYETTKVKDYRLHVVNGSPEMVTEFKRLISAFNDMAGMQALRYVDTAEEANSPIVIDKTLKSRTGNKVGTGQWFSTSEQENAFVTMPGDNPTRTVTYSMRLDFDQNYFDTRKEATAENLYDKEKLFFHEVGHGLELEHDPNPSNLMYELIDGKKDFPLFFKYVRTYMTDI